MTGRSRRDHGAAFQARVASKGERTLAGLAQRCDVHPK
jgi:hypothetical protein